MRFLMMVKSCDGEAGASPPSPELMAAIGALAEEELASGRMVLMGGLLPTAFGAKVRVEGGKVTVRDGPFAEARELVGGFAIFELPSKEAAVESSQRFMALHARVLGDSYRGEVEIRQMADDAPGGEGRPGLQR